MYGSNPTNSPIVVGGGTNSSDISPLEVTITPKYATSLMRLTCSINCSSNNSINAPRFTFLRRITSTSNTDWESTDILQNSIQDYPDEQEGSDNRAKCSFATAYANSYGGIKSTTFTFIDAPSTTGEIEYAIAVSIHGNATYYINRPQSNDNNEKISRTISTFEVEELFQ